MTQLLGYADLHMHTTASDGKPSVQQALDFIALHRSHLNVIAITDHDTLDASLWAYERRHLYSFDIITGVEVTSRDGHILALWVDKPIPTGMSLEDTAQAIREAGGLSVLAHPFHMQMEFVRRNARRYWRTPEVLLQAGLNGVEVHNAGIAHPGSNLAARHVAKKVGLAQLGNSDAHTLGAIGAGKTRFLGRTAADLRRAIESASTSAEGTAWNINDYIEYLHKEHQRRVMTSSAKMTSLAVGGD